MCIVVVVNFTPTPPSFRSIFGTLIQGLTECGSGPPMQEYFIIMKAGIRTRLRILALIIRSRSRIGSMNFSIFLFALLSFHLSSPGGGLHTRMAAHMAMPKFHRDAWQRSNPTFKPLSSGSQ